MVITFSWLQSWISVVLTVVCIIVLILIIFFCTCFEQKKNKQFYVIDERVMRNESVISPCNLHLFRNSSASPDLENVFTSKNLPFYYLNEDSKQDSDLMDSVEVAKSLDTGILKFEDYHVPLTTRDDLRSCLSQESLNSFYSAAPSTIARATSKESFVSLISEFDNNLVV